MTIEWASRLYKVTLAGWLIIGAAILFLIWGISNRIHEDAIIRRNGGHAARFRSWFPLDFFAGIHFICAITAHALRDDNVKFLYNCFLRAGKGRKYPYTFEVWPAGRRTLFTADPENIKAMLATQFHSYGKGERFHRDWGDLMGDSIFAVDGREWHDSRQRLRPLFTRQRISDLECFERHVQYLLPLLDEGRTVDMKDILSRFSLDTSADFSFGSQIDSLKCRNNDFFAALERIRHTQSLIERSTPLNFLIPRRQFRRDIRTVEEFIQPTIARATSLSQTELESLEKTDSNWSFVNACAALNRDPKFLRDELLAILVAGRDTTSTTMLFAIYELARNPHILADLRREIQETVGCGSAARKPSCEDLKRMRLLSNILSETLRLYPNAPFNIRTALEDTSLPRGGGTDGSGPIGLKAGTQVVYSTHVMHLSPEIYPDTGPEFPPADEFFPRRWDDWTPRPWTYIPFNGGPRICIGQQMAITQMAYVITPVFQCYSGVQLRMTEPDFSSGGWLRRGIEPDLPERFINSRLRMASEITLSPRSAVHMVFS